MIYINEHTTYFPIIQITLSIQRLLRSKASLRAYVKLQHDQRDNIPATRWPPLQPWLQTNRVTEEGVSACTIRLKVGSGQINSPGNETARHFFLTQQSLGDEKKWNETVTCAKLTLKGLPSRKRITPNHLLHGSLNHRLTQRSLSAGQLFRRFFKMQFEQWFVWR